jgi:2-keto-4-pentenoate hydratase
LNKTDVFASKPSFPQRAVLHKNRVIHKHNVLHKNHVLAGPVQGLFAACRIAAIHGGRLRAGRIIIHASSSAAVEILWARSHHGDIVAHASPRADLDSIHRRSIEREGR